MTHKWKIRANKDLSGDCFKALLQQETVRQSSRCSMLSFGLEENFHFEYLFSLFKL